MRKTQIAVIICLGGILAMSQAQGSSQQNPTANTTQSASTAMPSKKIFSGSLLIDTSATLSQQSVNSSGEDFSLSGLYRVDLGASLSEVLTASLRGGYSQEYSYVLSDGSSGDLTDSRLGLTAALGEIRKDLKLSVSSNLTLPTSKISQRAGLKSALSLGAGLKQKLKSWTLSLNSQITQYFHEYTVQYDGKLNLERSLSAALGVMYAVNEKISLSFLFQPTRSWTYQGTTRDRYMVNYEASYDVTQNLSLALGVYNDASALKSNGLEYNYALYDQSQFMGYFDLILTL